MYNYGISRKAGRKCLGLYQIATSSAIKSYYFQEPTAHPIVQRPNMNNEDLIQVLPEESMTDDNH